MKIGNRQGNLFIGHHKRPCFGQRLHILGCKLQHRCGGIRDAVGDVELGNSPCIYCAVHSVRDYPQLFDGHGSNAAIFFFDGKLFGQVARKGARHELSQRQRFDFFLRRTGSTAGRKAQRDHSQAAGLARTLGRFCGQNPGDRVLWIATHRRLNRVLIKKRFNGSVRLRRGRRTGAHGGIFWHLTFPFVGSVVLHCPFG